MSSWGVDCHNRFNSLLFFALLESLLFTHDPPTRMKGWRALRLFFDRDNDLKCDLGQLRFCKGMLAPNKPQ